MLKFNIKTMICLRLIGEIQQNTLQMFTGVYRVFNRFFCNICRENPVIFTDCREFAGKICKYYRVFPADIAEKLKNHPVNPCKHLQCNSIQITALTACITLKTQPFWLLKVILSFLCMSNQQR